MVIEVKVSGASMTNRKGACELLRQADPLKKGKLKRIFADGAYLCKLVGWVRRKRGIEIDVVKKQRKGVSGCCPKGGLWSALSHGSTILDA